MSVSPSPEPLRYGRAIPPLWAPSSCAEALRHSRNPMTARLTELYIKSPLHSQETLHLFAAGPQNSPSSAKRNNPIRSSLMSWTEEAGTPMSTPPWAQTLPTEKLALPVPNIGYLSRTSSVLVSAHAGSKRLHFLSGVRGCFTQLRSPARSSSCRSFPRCAAQARQSRGFRRDGRRSWLQSHGQKDPWRTESPGCRQENPRRCDAGGKCRTWDTDPRPRAMLWAHEALARPGSGSHW